MGLAATMVVSISKIDGYLESTQKKILDAMANIPQLLWIYLKVVSAILIPIHLL